MSSSDQQYPYPYDPEHPQRPAPPQWPDGTAGQHAGAQEPAAFDQGGTQTWQAPTWDTQYQPTIRPDGGPGQGQAQVQGYGQGQGDGYGYGQGQGHGQSHGHGQPQQPGPYGQAQPPSYGQSQQPEPYAQPQPYG
ncbi:hypothetical protein GTW37_27460, partial [Streptomyces sp. SID4931]|nr:hypothetical protein [Streptomyces sp. SID4931]